MFTGIVEKSVLVHSSQATPSGRRLVIEPAWDDVRVGDSIAVNGCCLTAAQVGTGGISFDIVPETLSKTNLGLLKPGDRAHVERALAMGARLDGHFVQGHVDGVATLVERITANGECRLIVRPSTQLMKYVSPRGSVALDGVSLTIAEIRENCLSVALIPTTLALTQLGTRPIGWPLNFEADMIVKSVVTFLESRRIE